MFFKEERIRTVSKRKGAEAEAKKNRVVKSWKTEQLRKVI